MSLSKKSSYLRSTKSVLDDIIAEINTDCLSSSQQSLVKYFSDYKNKQVTLLSQKDFDYGTYRITKPGYYILTSDIVFHPNPKNDFQPTEAQIKTGKYPVPGPYNLHFFAALTIETEGVVLDLNHHTIQQSKEHFLMQRFYANIELASAPFIGKQGPSPGISGDHRSGTKTAIINGTLGFSSHHGIHGNESSNVLLGRLQINNFQVGGISLNGLSKSIFYDITISEALTNVPVLSSFSQAVFLLPFLKRVMDNTPEAILYVNGKALTIQTIHADLKKSIRIARNDILKHNKTSIGLFHNEGGLSDANMYGISLNVNGVLIGAFLKERPKTATVGNSDIYLEKINIRNITSNTKEIIGLSDASILGGKVNSYGKGKPAITGPVGGLFNFGDYVGSRGVYIIKCTRKCTSYYWRVFKGRNHLFHQDYY